LSGEGNYRLVKIENTWFEYDRQSDILYIYFEKDVEEADEEVLIGDNIVYRIKDGRIISVMIMDFLKNLGLTTC